MPIISQLNDTLLKSLKYGSDQLDGGTSGQPYITTDVNDPNLTNLALARGGLGSLLQKAGIVPSITIDNTIGKDSGFMRGGIVGSTTAGIVDAVRVGSWILNNPLWIAKQVGLQLSNPRLEKPKNPSLLTNPGNILSLATDGILQPTRTYNLGINTLLQVPVNAFGVHFNRHGLGPVSADNEKYEAIVRANNKIDNSEGNRLISLKSKLNVGQPTISTSPLLTNVLGFLSNIPVLGSIIKTLTSGASIDNYITGPGSTYGIGLTTIRRFDNTTSANDSEFLNTAYTVAVFNTRTYDDLNIREPLVGSFLGLSKKYNGYISLPNNIEKSITSLDSNTAVDYQGASSVLRDYSELFKATKAVTSIEQSIPFSDAATYNPTSPANTPFSVERKSFKTVANIGLNRNRKEQFNDYKYYGTGSVGDEGSRKVYDNTYTLDRYDSDILTVMFRGVDPFTQNEERWAFSAYLSGFKDDFNATWNDVNYIGRSETFYIYSKFRRSVSFDLKIPCFNRTQLFEKHRALGQLASTTAGRYDDTQGKTNALGGMLLRLNVGNYLVGEYAVMNNLSYSIPNDSAWDITPEARLAMYIEASFSFNIVHQKLPQYQPSRRADGTSLPVGFFGYLPDTQKGDAQFLQIPGRTTDIQNQITDNFAINLDAASDKGYLLAPTYPKPVVGALSRLL